MPVALRGIEREGDERQTTGSVPVALRGIEREGDERQTTGPVPVALRVKAMRDKQLALCL